jgi:putative ABC transport system permease protein
MNNLTICIRALSKGKQDSVIKIVSLGCGLAIGLVLLAKVSFEYTYDTFYPDSERIYQVMERSTGRFAHETGRIPGGFAYYMGVDIPEVEAATRYRYLRGDAMLFFNAQREVFSGRIILADSALLDVIPRRRVAGDLRQTLATPMSALLSRSLAARMGDDVIGQRIELDPYPGKAITIGGIFEDVPENSSFRYDIALSLSSLPAFDSFDGSFMADNHNQFTGLVKLVRGTDPASLQPALRALQERRQDAAFYEEMGYWYDLMPITETHTHAPEVKQKIRMMLILALSLLLITVVNYILMVISSLVDKARSVAVYKCYGAQRADVNRLILTETILCLVLSLLFATFLIGSFREGITEILGTSLGALFSWRSIGLAVGVCVLILLVTAWIPARILSGVPVSSVFRLYRQSRRGWKQALLFVQFIIATGFFVMLVIVWGQYRLLINDAPGYSYDRLVHIDISTVEQGKRQTAVDALLREKGVASVTASSQLPIAVNMSGGWIQPGDNNTVETNAVNLGRVSGNYLSVMDIPLLEGRGFTSASSPDEIVVSRDFAAHVSELAGWTDGVVGKTVRSGAYGGVRTIVGVFDNIRMASLKRPEGRPATLALADNIPDILIVKLHELTTENLQSLQAVLEETMPGKLIRVIPYQTSVAGLYDQERLDRNSILACCFTILLIVLMGLTAYVNNEVNRRAAEVALRKINGARVDEILWLFLADIVKISLPALLIGSAITYYFGEKWLEGFSLKLPLTPGLFIACNLAILALILSFVVINSLRIAHRNPVESIKTNG